MMNKVVRTSSRIQFEGLFNLHPSFFHSSSILERNRRPNQDSRYNNYYNKRVRKMNGKDQFPPDAGVFAEELFKSWKYHDENYCSPYSRTPRRFTQEFVTDRNIGGRSRRIVLDPWSGKTFEFCEDDEFDIEEFDVEEFDVEEFDVDEFEVEDMSRAAFQWNKRFKWSSTDEEPKREYTSRYNTSSGRYQRYKYDDEYDSSEESNCLAADLTSYRRALGLKATGPLCLEDIKNAYRTCALKWHPDRHQGSSKAVAEEKFKKCSAAYQSLCDQMVS